MFEGLICSNLSLSHTHTQKKKTTQVIFYLGLFFDVTNFLRLIFFFHTVSLKKKKKFFSL